MIFRTEESKLYIKEEGVKADDILKNLEN